MCVFSVFPIEAHFKMLYHKAIFSNAPYWNWPKDRPKNQCNLVPYWSFEADNKRDSHPFIPSKVGCTFYNLDFDTPVSVIRWEFFLASGDKMKDSNAKSLAFNGLGFGILLLTQWGWNFRVFFSPGRILDQFFQWGGGPTGSVIRGCILI